MDGVAQMLEHASDDAVFAAVELDADDALVVEVLCILYVVDMDEFVWYKSAITFVECFQRRQANSVFYKSTIRNAK